MNWHAHVSTRVGVKSTEIQYTYYILYSIRHTIFPNPVPLWIRLNCYHGRVSSKMRVLLLFHVFLVECIACVTNHCFCKPQNLRWYEMQVIAVNQCSGVLFDRRSVTTSLVHCWCVAMSCTANQHDNVLRELYYSLYNHVYIRLSTLSDLINKN